MDETVQAEVRYAGFWPRLAAYLVDSLIFGLGALLAGGALSLVSDVLGRLVMNFGAAGLFIWAWTTGATPGMRLIGLRVTKEDGSLLTVTSGVLRMIGIYISSLALLIGLVWVAFDARKQGWHDKIASTVVTETKPVSSGLVAAILIGSAIVALLFAVLFFVVLVAAMAVAAR